MDGATRRPGAPSGEAMTPLSQFDRRSRRFVRKFAGRKPHVASSTIYVGKRPVTQYWVRLRPGPFHAALGLARSCGWTNVGAGSTCFSLGNPHERDSIVNFWNDYPEA